MGKLVTAGVLVAAMTTVAAADFITPDSYGWSRESADSTYFEWDIFTSTTGGNVPDVGQFPDPVPNGWVAPDVVELTGEAFITSSGNIYSPFAPIAVDITVPNYGYNAGETTCLLQVRVAGAEMDTSLTNIGGVFPTEILEIGRVDLGDLGFQVDWLFVFDLESNADQYVINMPTGEFSVSIDSISVDTFTQADACAADFNADGSVNTQDVLAFLNAWSAGDDAADVNADETVNTQDVIFFLNLWTAGC